MSERALVWPRTLSGRLALLLLAGMLMAQLLTGTIWFDARYERVLEIPARLAAAQAAQTLRLLQDPVQAGLQPATLSGPTLIAAWGAQQPPPPLSTRDQALQTLLSNALADALGQAQPLQLLQVELLDAQGQPGQSLFTARQIQGRFVLQVQALDGRWLHLDIRQHQAGLQLRPMQAVGDYLLRIYALRMLLILLLTLLAVRWLTRPLTRLAKAARALGENLDTAPLPLEGPREVRQAAEAFNQMQQQLVQGLQAREQLLAAVSHDLRSPLTRLRLRTELLPDPDARARWRADLEDMQALVDSVLDYSSSRRLQGERVPVDVDALVRAACADAAETHALANGIEIVGRALASYPGHARSLKRAVANLLDNALVHGGGKARVQVLETPGQLHLLVQDEGPGVDMQALPRLMQPFERSEVGSDATRVGVGLGLSIAEAIVTAHAGRLLLRNRVAGPGLEAEIILPRG